MTERKAIRRAQEAAVTAGKDYFVVYDPTASDAPKQDAYYVTDEIGLDTFFDGAQVITEVAPH